MSNRCEENIYCNCVCETHKWNFNKITLKIECEKCNHILI